MPNQGAEAVSRLSLVRHFRCFRRGFTIAMAASFGIGLLAAQTTATPQSQPYEALYVLEQSAQGSADASRLLQLARAQEVYADRALPTYARLAALEPANSPARTAALERGFLLALRDGRLDRAAEFSAQLQAAGHADSTSLLHPSTATPSDTAAQLRALSALTGSESDFFAAIPNRAHGCDSLHLLPANPYEDDENQYDPVYLAERAAELKLT